MITVFTPTFNRAYALPKLYESLCYQTSNQFEWVIVDDGSTDNTKEIVSNWINEGKIRMDGATDKVIDEYKKVCG